MFNTVVIDLTDDAQVGLRDRAAGVMPLASTFGFDARGEYLAAAVGDRLTVFRVADGRRAEEYCVSAVASTNDRLDPAIRLPNMVTRDLFFTTNGQYLVASTGYGSGREYIMAFDRRSGDRILKVSDPDDIGDEDFIGCRAVAVSSDGESIAIAGGASSVSVVRISDGARQTVLDRLGQRDEDRDQQYQDRFDQIVALAFDRTGQYIVVACRDRIDVFCVETRERIGGANLPGLPGFATFASDPLSVVFGETHETIIVARASQGRVTTQFFSTSGELIRETVASEADVIRSAKIDPTGDGIAASERQVPDCVWWQSRRGLFCQHLRDDRVTDVSLPDFALGATAVVNPSATAVAYSAAPGIHIVPLEMRIR